MRKRLLFGVLGAVLVGLLTAAASIALIFSGLLQTEINNRLSTAMTLLSSELSSLTEDPQAFAQKQSQLLSKIDPTVRITIVDLQGRVLGESRREGEAPMELGNHLDREEVQEALRGEEGYAVRMSETMHEKYTYGARLIEGEYILRVALSTRPGDQAAGNLWWSLVPGVLVGVLFAGGFACFLGRRETRPVEELTRTARRIAAGDYALRAGEYRDEAGELARSFNQMCDALHTALEELREKRVLLESVLHGMEDAVFAVDQQGRVLLANERCRELLGAGALKEGEILAENTATGLLKMLRRAEQEPDPVRETLRVSVPRDQVLSVYAARAGLEGGQHIVVAVLADRTRMRKLEQLRSEFVANVTHELKTPLTSIRGFVELLKSGDRDEETRRYFYDVIDIEAERLHRLIDDMLALSEIENAKDDPSLTRCELGEELRRTVARMEPAAQKGGIVLRLQAPEKLYVMASSGRLQQLFGNLIENAVKYNRPGGTVTVTATGQKELVTVKVQDTGIGIPTEHQSRIFERFYRVDKSRSRQIGGTGLGLSIVKHLVTLYGGDVGVESAAGKGSTFTVRLPRVE